MNKRHRSSDSAALENSTQTCVVKKRQKIGQKTFTGAHAILRLRGTLLRENATYIFTSFSSFLASVFRLCVLSLCLSLFLAHTHTIFHARTLALVFSFPPVDSRSSLGEACGGFTLNSRLPMQRRDVRIANPLPPTALTLLLSPYSAANLRLWSLYTRESAEIPAPRDASLFFSNRFLYMKYEIY